LLKAGSMGLSQIGWKEHETCSARSYRVGDLLVVMDADVVPDDDVPWTKRGRELLSNPHTHRLTVERST
jgi:hypothetical protein